MYDDGKEALVIEFRNLLGRHCRPVPPVMVLDMISTDEGNAFLHFMQNILLITNWKCFAIFFSWLNENDQCFCIQNFKVQMIFSWNTCQRKFWLSSVWSPRGYSITRRTRSIWRITPDHAPPCSSNLYRGKRYISHQNL